MILTQKSRQRSYNKEKIGNHLKFKYLKLVTPEHSNNIFIALGTLNKRLEKTTKIKSTLPPGSYKTSLYTSPPPKSLSLHCKQINKVKNELDGQPSSLLACTHGSNYEAVFSPKHLVFLELDTGHCYLDFKLLNEINNEVIPGTFYLQLLNKDHEHIQQ